jgi:hypothetical protein
MEKDTDELEQLGKKTKSLVPAGLLKPNEKETEPPPAAMEVRRRPEDWATRLGHMHQAKENIPQSTTHADWKHATADRLHGWTKHAHHYQKDPLLLTQKDYETALENAAEYPLKEAHEPALSPLLKPKETV